MKAWVLYVLCVPWGLAQGADRYGITALTRACIAGDSAAVSAALAAGDDPKHSLRGGEDMLMLAARTGLPEPVKLLLAKGAPTDHADDQGQTALMWAAAEGHAEVMQLLIDSKADPRVRLNSGFTAMLFAAREGQRSAVDVLLKAGIPASEAIITSEPTRGRDADPGTSAVDLALENGHYALALHLIERGADPNDLRSGVAPLHRLSIVRRPPRGDDESGQPPPETHGPMSSLDCIRALAKAGADVNLPVPKGPKEGRTPCYFAARTADLPMLQLLVELGADPLRPNADGSTPLMAAAGLGCTAPDEEAGTEEECLATCEYLLSKGADINAVDRKGQTAMHGAAYKSLPKVAHYLAAKGAKIDIWNRKNSSGWTPLLIAQGFRPGNFKPSVPTIEAISQIMRTAGVEPPPPPDRETMKKPKGYNQR